MCADLIKAGYEGEGDECDSSWVTLPLEGVVVWLFIGTQKRLVALHSALDGSRSDFFYRHKPGGIQSSPLQTGRICR